MSSASITDILLISWEVRNPSKKCTKGTEDRSVAKWATNARSWASWTLWEHSMAQPVCAEGTGGLEVALTRNNKRSMRDQQ